MEDTRFDTLAKDLAEGRTRRSVLRGLIGGGAALLATRAETSLAAPKEKVTICHWSQDLGYYEQISVGQNAVQAHSGHQQGLDKIDPDFSSIATCGDCNTVCLPVDSCTPARCDTGACNAVSGCGAVDSCTPAACLSDGTCKAFSNCAAVDSCTPTRCLSDGTCNAVSDCGAVDPCTPARCESDGVCNAVSNCASVDACTPALCQGDGTCREESICTVVDDCTTDTCMSDGSCNQVSTCTDFDTCGGGGEAGLCGCTPECEVATCAHDGCGGSCAQNCPELHTCVAGRCFRAQTPTGLPRCPFEGVAPCTGTGPEGVGLCLVCDSIGCTQPCTSTNQCPGGQFCSYLGACDPTFTSGFCVTGYQPA